MYDGVNAAFPTLGALMLAVGVYIVSTQFKFKHIEKLLNFVAGGILPIYLIHMCIIETFNHFVGDYTLNIVLALIGAIIVCCICTLFGKVIQRIPVLCWLIKI